jgi:tRNA modification GTPase
MTDDTIAAIATALGEAGLALVRVSGPAALSIADTVFQPANPKASKPSLAPTHTLHYGHVVHAGARVDEALLAVLRAPRTYTREDVVEITCHGGLLTTRLVLDTVLRAGARLAHPGEFTKRAFLNGRIDLAQAEAVADLIHARTDLALRAAQEQLAGHLSRRIETLRDQLMRVLAHVEAHLDFPDEDIAPDTQAAMIEQLHGTLTQLNTILRTAHEGQILRRGLRVAILGRPNAGKSSLLNLLLGRDRAIVSPQPGTTRDTIAETASIRGFPLVLVDTAGLRDSIDPIEQEGVRRSLETARHADVILHVLDASQPLAADDARYLDTLRSRARIVVQNKSDLGLRLELPGDLELHTVAVSCKTGEGLDALKQSLEHLVWRGAIPSEMTELMINARHQNALERAREALDRTIRALAANALLDLAATELRITVNAVGEVVGKTTTEDLLDSIFSQFCIGK